MENNQDEESIRFKTKLLDEHGIIVVDGYVEQVGDAPPNGKDLIQGVVYHFMPACKAACDCGRPGCKGAAVDPLDTYLVMN